MADRYCFLLGNGRHDVDDEPICLGHIDGNELGPRLHEVRDEGDIASQSIELGDDQGGLVLPAELQGIQVQRVLN